MLQVLYSPKLDVHKERALQKLCAKTTSAIDLADARVQVGRSLTQLQT